MGLVLWIDENTFATGLIEKVFNKRDLKFYTISNVSDFGYLVEDLRPEVIVLDSKTGLKDLEALKRQYKETKQFLDIPVILIDPSPELDFIQKRVGEIQRAIDPFKTPELLEKILKA
jgi:DNA-binding NtrC family response regulator